MATEPVTTSTVVTGRSRAGDDVTLVVDEAGAGQRPLALVHGFGGCRDDFSPLVGDLVAAGWHVLAPDNRGHGDSAKLPDEADYDVTAFASDVLALADSRRWERFSLLGHSLGGVIAQLVALEAPERVESLVLMDTTPSGIDLDPELVARAASVVRRHGLAALVERLREVGDPLGTPAHERAARTIPGYRDRGERNTLRCSPAMYAAVVEQLVSAPDRSADLARLRIPALVVVGAEDAMMLGASERLAAALAGARLVVVPDAGHSPQFENGAGLLAPLLAFLAGVAGA